MNDPRTRTGFGATKAGSALASSIYAFAVFVFFYPLAELAVAASAAGAAFLGALVAVPLARTRLRSHALLLVALPLALLGLVLSHVLGDAAWFARALGPADALLVESLVKSLSITLACAAALRALALRRRVFSLLEVLFVGLSFAELVVAHRFGAINRPFELADSIIAQGGDPSVALLLIGAAAGALVITLLLHERSIWRSLLHMTLALCLLLLVFSSTRILGLPAPPSGASGLGLRPGEKASNDDQDSRGQQRRDGRSDNENLEFRDNYDSEGRQVPLAVVLLHDDYSPPTGLYYFRQTAFSQYNGKRLVSAMQAGVDTDVAPSFVTAPTDLVKTPNAAGDRVELDTTVALLADHTRPFALESAERIVPLSNPDSARFRRVYRVTSSALATRSTGFLTRPTGDPAWSETIRKHYTQAPDDPRYAKLAEEIVATIKPELQGDAVARALAVSLWLSREGTYSLKSGHASAEDPTADFLFGDRTGYCVHFSHAAVYLMRALGVPARVGAGYVVDEAARQGGSSILVTGANSHAWPEFYVDGVGWVVNDVSPERSLDPPPPPPDPDLQRLLGDMARGLKPMPQGAERPLEPILASARAFRDALLRGLAVGLLGALAMLYLVKVWRRVAPAFAGAALPRVGYRAELDRLADVRLHRRVGETREAFAARVAAEVPSFSRLTERHLAAVFGSATVDRAELRRLRAEVARELGASVSWWRRGLGALVPWSWLRSR